MEIVVSEKSSVQILNINGRLDASTAKKFKEKFESLIRDGAMVSALRKVSKKGGDLKIAGARNPVRMLLELTRLHRMFDIYESTPEALNNYVLSK